MRRTPVFPTRRLSRTLLGTTALSAGLLARSLIAPDSHAAIGGCRSDPVALLSNGYTLDLSAALDDSTSDLQQVQYTLDIPVGVTLLSWTDTAALGPYDTFSVNAVNAAGHFSVAVKADTETPDVRVTASTDLVSPSDVTLSTYAVSGVSQETRWTHVSG